VDQVGRTHNFSLVVQGKASIFHEDGATLGVGEADGDGLLDWHGGVKSGIGFAVDVLLGEVNEAEAGGSGFCVVLCVPAPSK
jgi:hypothetical protein